MTNYEYSFMEFARFVHAEYVATVKKLEEYPSGNLVIMNRNGYDRFYREDRVEGKNKLTYLSKKKCQTEISMLFEKKKNYKSQKKYVTKLKKWLRAIRTVVLEIVDAQEAGEFKCIASQKNTHSEFLNFYTECGIKVRSKSEVMIANWFYAQKISFEYEPEVIIDGQTFYPDFRFRHPLSGRVMYLEHLGLLSKESYVKSWHYKKEMYARYGIYENVNLITTTEESVKKIYEDFPLAFTMKRYGELVKFLKGEIS